MKFVILAALIAAVASGSLSNEASSEDQSQSPWKPGQLYRYEVKSHTLTRHQEGASSGSAFKARFVVRVRSPGHLLAKLENPQHAQVHQELPNNRELPKDLKLEPVENFDKPFEVKLQGARVLSLNLPASLPVHHENLIKGLISALQVDLSTYRSARSHHDNYDKETQQGVYRKMEADVTGDCETLYTVSPVASEWRRELPKFASEEEPIEITKSKDYDSCHHRVAYHFGVPAKAIWSGIAEKPRQAQLIKRSTVSRILSGKQGPIYKTETTTTVHVHPHMSGKQKAEVLSYVSLRLTSYEKDSEGEWASPEAQRITNTLIYAMSTKQIDPKNKSSSSSSSSSSESAEVADKTLVNQGRIRRSTKQPKIVTINKVIIEKRNDGSSSSSSEEMSGYVNANIPASAELNYGDLYLEPEPHTENKQNPANAQKLVQDMAQQLQNPNNMPKSDFLAKFNILVRVISSMTYEQLSQTSRSIEVGRSSTNNAKLDMWMIYRDAVAQAGTMPAFRQLKSWIQSKKIEGEEAAEVIASLVHSMRYPTKETMSQFFKMAISDEVRQQKYLNSTALIAATTFINMGQVNNYTAKSYYPTQMYGRMSDKHNQFVQEDILPRLSQMLQQAIQDQDSHKCQVYIKAIGNLGHRAILDVFAPYLEGRIPTTMYLRAKMVENLDVLAHQKDSHVRVVLYSILRNTAEPYEVRLMAINNIFMARPTEPMMQAMAQMTHDDPNVHVRGALISAIESAAELKNPRYLELARSAQAVRYMLSKDRHSVQYSTKVFNDYFDKENDIGMTYISSMISSEDSIINKYQKASVRTGWNKESTITASFSAFEKLVDYIKKIGYGNLNSNKKYDVKYSAKKISELLNINRDKLEPLEFSFFFNLMNQQRYFALSESDLQQMPAVLREALSKLEKGVDGHYTKVLNQANVHIMFPVAMGVPFIFKYKEPTVVHAQVKAQAKVDLPSEENQELSAKGEAEIQFTYARNIEGSVGFFDTLSGQYASAGIVNKLQFNVPVKLQTEMKSGQTQMRLKPLRPDQDTTIVHYSVWPYTTCQKKDSLTPVSLDPATKQINRKHRVSSIDQRFGQQVGIQFQIQGYSYSSDYENFGTWLKKRDLSDLIYNIYQRDIATTHYNFRYLGKLSKDNQGVKLSAVYKSTYEKSQNMPWAPSTLEDWSPNSEARRQELMKKVSSDINTPHTQVLDLCATFEAAQATYLLTAAMANSPVDQKIKYAFSAGQQLPQGQNQINGVGLVVKPELSPLNFAEAIKKNLKMTYDFEIKFGQKQNGNIRIQGHTERSKKYTEELQREPLVKQCEQEIARNNQYQPACHKMIILAHAPDFSKTSVTYKDISPAFRYAILQASRYLEYFSFFYTEHNPLKTTADGKLEIEVHASYLDNVVNMVLNSRLGEYRVHHLPILGATPGAMAVYVPVTPIERVFNYYYGHQYQPYCTVDGSRIKTFSNRTYDYALSRSWHVVVQDDPNKPWNDQLVILARKTSENQQEAYISFLSKHGQRLEIELKPSQQDNKPQIKVATSAKKVSEGDLTNYWDESEKQVLLQHYTQPDGVLMLKIRQNRLRAMYDGQRLVVFLRDNRNHTRGICGLMSGDHTDDYLTPYGIVDKAEHFAASYSLNDDNSDPKTVELQAKAKQLAYQRKYQYTTILKADPEWRRGDKTSSSSSEQSYGSENVYRTRNYEKERRPCQQKPKVQYYENHGEICITTQPLGSCQSHCAGRDYQVQGAQVVCKPKLDRQFQAYRDQILQGEEPQVSGVAQLKQFKVPATCRA